MSDTTPIKIDFVVPFVDNQEQVWRDTYISFCKKNRLQNKIIDLYSSRFNGARYIDYQLKLINKNMPWINKIYLLLSNIEQAPKDLPSNCVIILHKQFIPQQFLPTFNSTTIEMFLWNIPNLSEYFIYANDDMLPIRELKPSDFFVGDKIKIKWIFQQFYHGSTVFAYQCRNNIISYSKKLSLGLSDMEIIRPVHSFTPMIKSHCLIAFELLKEFILPHIRAFRTEFQHNQYIYPLYEYFRYGTIDSEIDFLYTECDQEFDLSHDIVCVNLEKDKEYLDKFLKYIRQLCE